MDANCNNLDHTSPAITRLDNDVCSRAASIFRALGDPGRLKVLALLAQQEMCVTEISLALDEQMTTISQRLKLLKSERLVHSRRDGKHLFYKLTDSHVAHLLANALDHASETDN